MRTLLAILFGLPAGAFAQSDVIRDFTARQLGEGVVLDWFIPAGQSCIDMQIQRGGDTSEFAMIGIFNGLCGQIAEDVDYDWYDPGPLQPNRTYYYRIWASNGTVVSEVRPVTVLETAAGALTVVPNPVRSSAEVYYANPAGEPVSVHIYDMQGREIRAAKPESTAPFLLEVAGLARGLYLLKVRHEGEVRACRRIFLR